MGGCPRGEGLRGRILLPSRTARVASHPLLWAPTAGVPYGAGSGNAAPPCAPSMTCMREPCVRRTKSAWGGSTPPSWIPPAAPGGEQGGGGGITAAGRLWLSGGAADHSLSDAASPALAAEGSGGGGGEGGGGGVRGPPELDGLNWTQGSADLSARRTYRLGGLLAGPKSSLIPPPHLAEGTAESRAGFPASQVGWPKVRPIPYIIALELTPTPTQIVNLCCPPPHPTPPPQWVPPHPTTPMGMWDALTYCFQHVLLVDLTNPSFGSLRWTRGPAPAPPLNTKTPAMATDRLACAPRCVCIALCVDRLACGPPCLWTAKPPPAAARFARRGGQPPHPP